MAKECFGLGMPALRTAEAGNFHLARVPFFGFLRGVREAGRVAQGFDLGCGDVNIITRSKHHRVVGDFVIVDRGLLTGNEPGVENELRESAMIAVIIDRPVSKKDVRVVRGEDLEEFFIVCVVDDGSAVDLRSEGWTRAKNSARLLRFGGTDGGAIGFGNIWHIAIAFTTIQIKLRDFVT